MKRHWILLLILLSFTPQSVLFAYNKPSLAIIELYSKTLAKDELEAYKSILKKRFKKSDFLKSTAIHEIDESAIQTLAIEKNYDKDINAANKLFYRGKKQYENIDFKNAIKTLKKAISKFLNIKFYLENNAEFVKSYIYLGLSYLADSKKQAGLKEFKKALKLNPRFLITTKDFPPHIVNTYNKIKSKINKLPKGTIEISITPGSANVFLNGNRLSKKKSKVLAGQYFIKASEFGYKMWTDTIEVSPSSTSKVKINLTRQTGQVEKFFKPVQNTVTVSQNVVNTLMNICILKKSDLLLLGEIEAISESNFVNVKLQLFDSRLKEFSKIYFAKITRNNQQSLHEIVKLLGQCINDDGLVIPNCSKVLVERMAREMAATPDEPIMPLRGPLVIESKPVYKKTWFWITVGSVIAAGIATYFVLDAFVLTDSEGTLPENGSITIRFPGG